MIEALPSRLTVVSSQRLDDPGMMLGGEAHATRVAEVGPHIAPGNLPEGRDQSQQSLVGAAFEQSSVPFLVECYAAVHIAPDSGKLAVDLAQTGQPNGRDLPGCLKREALERGKNGPAFPHLRPVERADPETSAHVGFQDSVPSQAKQRLPDRRPAHAQEAGNLGVPDSATHGVVAAVDPFQQLAIDLVSEGSTGYDESPTR